MILKSVDNDDQDDAEDDNDDDSVAMTMRMAMMVDRVDAAWRRRFNETLKSSQVVSSHSNVSAQKFQMPHYSNVNISFPAMEMAWQFLPQSPKVSKV